jgi:hypothetical protein
MRLLLATVLAAVAASAAVAAPTGYRDTTRLQPIGQALSPGTLVYCSSGEAQWQADVSVRFPSATRVIGYYVGGVPPEVFLSPGTCRALEGWLRGKNVPTLRALAVHSLSFVHEIVHTQGVVGEREADCGALRILPGVLRVHFRVKNTVTLRKVMQLARAENNAKPYEYRCF